MLLSPLTNVHKFIVAAFSRESSSEREQQSLHEVTHAGHKASSRPADLAVAVVSIPGSAFRAAKYSSSVRWRKT